MNVEEELKKMMEEEGLSMPDLVGSVYIDDPDFGHLICKWCGENLSEQDAAKMCPESGGQACPHMDGFEVK